MAGPPTSVPPPLLNLTIEFGGGMELLFSDQHIHTISLPSHYSPSTFSLSPPPNHAPNEGQGKNSDVRFLIWWLRTYLLADKARYDLFSQGENIRPGILILINSTDWELEGELEYQLKEGDEVVFISTLHGG